MRLGYCRSWKSLDADFLAQVMRDCGVSSRGGRRVLLRGKEIAGGEAAIRGAKLQVKAALSPSNEVFCQRRWARSMAWPKLTAWSSQRAQPRSGTSMRPRERSQLCRLRENSADGKRKT